MQVSNDPVVNVLRRIRLRVRRESKHYPQISAVLVVAWIDKEIKRRKS